MRTKTSSLIHPFFDFWLLGGASIVILLVMVFVEGARESIPSVAEHVMHRQADKMLAHLQPQ